MLHMKNNSTVYSDDGWEAVFVGRYNIIYRDTTIETNIEIYEDGWDKGKPVLFIGTKQFYGISKQYQHQIDPSLLKQRVLDAITFQGMLVEFEDD